MKEPKRLREFSKLEPQTRFWNEKSSLKNLVFRKIEKLEDKKNKKYYPKNFERGKKLKKKIFKKLKFREDD